MFVCLGIYSVEGDPLLFQQFRHELKQERCQLLVQDYLKVASDLRLPIVQKDSNCMFVYEHSSILFVGVTVENMAPLQGIEILKAFAALLGNMLGGLSEEKVRSNCHVCLEAINECIDNGIPVELSPDAVRERLHSKPLASKGALAAFLTPRQHSHYRQGQFRALIDTQASGREETFVDMLEQVTAVMDASGACVSAECSGVIQMMSFVERDGYSAVLKLLKFHAAELAGSCPFMRNNSSFHCFAEEFHLHHDARLADDLDANGYSQISSPISKGERALATYYVDLVTQAKPEAVQLPVTLAVNVAADPDYDRKALITITATCNVSPKNGAQSLSIEVPLPRYVDKASCSAEGAEKNTVTYHEYDAATSTLRWQIKSKGPRPVKSEVCLRGQQSLTLVIKAMLKDKAVDSAFSRNMGAINLSYQMHGVGVSGMKICFLDFIEADGRKFVPSAKDPGPSKWLRTMTASTSTTFRVA